MPCLQQRETLPLKFNLNPKEDFKKIKMTEKEKLTAATENVLTILGIGDSKKAQEPQNPTFELEVTEISGMLTQVSFNPNRDVVEDRQRLMKFN